MSTSFADTIARNTMNLDVTRMLGGRRRLAGLCTDLFLIVIAMRESRDLGEPQALRKLVIHYLDLFEKNARAQETPQEVIDNARYAMVALLDETVLSSAGACRDFWISRPLQLDLFGSSLAGQEFYRKLDLLLEAPEKNGDSLEIFYLCLSLGFEGKYKMGDTAMRSAVVEKTGRALSRVRVRIGKGLSPHGERGGTAAAPMRRVRANWLPWWIIAAAGGVVTVLVWTVLLVVNGARLNSVLASLTAAAGGR